MEKVKKKIWAGGNPTERCLIIPLIQGELE